MIDKYNKKNHKTNCRKYVLINERDPPRIHNISTKCGFKLSSVILIFLIMSPRPDKHATFELVASDDFRSSQALRTIRLQGIIPHSANVVTGILIGLFMGAHPLVSTQPPSAIQNNSLKWNISSGTEF